METFYTTHAIEQMRTVLLPTFRRIAPKDSKYIDDLLGVLESGVKFRLPDAGELLGIDRKTRHFSSDDFDILHMPYPVSVLEYAFAADKHTIPANDIRHISGRRITLVLDVPPDQGQGGVFADALGKIPEFAEKGGLVIAGYWSNNDEDTNVASRGRLCEWEFSTAVAIIPRDQTAAAANSPPRGVFQASRGDLTLYFAAMTPYLTTAHVAEFGEQLVLRTMMRDLDDDVHVAWDFMLALSCNNVGINPAGGESREKLNKKRVANKKVPFFEYKVLHIQGAKLDASASAVGGRGLTETGRNAPRMHLRRGHMRNLGPGRRTWVNMAIVGAAVDGRISKDYVVTPSQQLSSSPTKA
jgi:hypothetical protein